MDGRSAMPVDNQKLPVIGMVGIRDHRLQRRLGRQPGGKLLKRSGAKPWVGHILAGDRADTGPRMGAARRDRRGDALEESADDAARARMRQVAAPYTWQACARAHLDAWETILGRP